MIGRENKLSGFFLLAIYYMKHKVCTVTKNGKRDFFNLFFVLQYIMQCNVKLSNDCVNEAVLRSKEKLSA